MCHSPLLVYNMQVPLNFLFAYLVILEKNNIFSIYLQKNLTKPYSSCLLSFLVILWIVKLNRPDITASGRNIHNIIAQNLWGFGSMNWHLSGLWSKRTAEGAPAWFKETKGRQENDRLLRVESYIWCPLLESLVKVRDFKKLASTEFQTWC